MLKTETTFLPRFMFRCLGCLQVEERNKLLLYCQLHFELEWKRLCSIELQTFVVVYMYYVYRVLRTYAVPCQTSMMKLSCKKKQWLNWLTIFAKKLHHICLSHISDRVLNKLLLHRDHSFRTYAKFHEKLAFLTLWYAHARGRISG